MRRKGAQLTLSTEHRAAPGRDHIPLQLTQTGPALALRVVESVPTPTQLPATPTQRVRQALAGLTQPASLRHLRQLCGIRTTALCSALSQLSANGEVARDATGYQLKTPFPLAHPIDPQGNGNRKHPLCPSGG